MRPLSPREILLQNLVATSATLLFRASKTLDNRETKSLHLIIEIDTWFRETKSDITKILSEPVGEESLPVRSVESNGQNWKAPRIAQDTSSVLGDADYADPFPEIPSPEVSCLPLYPRPESPSPKSSPKPTSLSYFLS